jgi:Tol biopolymer transport system component
VVPKLPHWRLQSIPRHLPWAQVRALVDSVDTSTPLGLRDRAMLLLIATLGLRNQEVRNLKLTEIHWQAGEIRLAETKSRRERALPLPLELGSALAEYVLQGRPQLEVPQVFVRHRAPLGPITSTNGIGNIVRKHLLRARIPAPSQGAHLLRHSLATRMVNQGVEVKQVADLLGHASVMPALGGNPRRVAALRSDFLLRDGPPQWSPDGRELACVRCTSWSEWLVEIVSLEGGASRRLPLPGPTNEPRGWELRWSPDGRFLAYTTAWDPSTRVVHVWVVRLDDGEAFPITEGETLNQSPSFSPDGRFVYFVSNREGTMDLWRRRLTGDGPTGEPARVTTGVEMLYARFSPDGSRLAFTKGRLQGGLWRVPLLEDRRATWSDAQALIEAPGWLGNVSLSPDHKELVFSRGGQDERRLWTVAAAGGEAERLPIDTGDEQVMPQWSPDGKTIAFHSAAAIWVVPRTGPPASRLTGSEAYDLGASWSPDGLEIAFTSISEGKPDVWVVPARGGEARRLTSGPGDHWGGLGSWSPNGREVLFWLFRDGQWDIGTIPSGSGEPRLLTHDRAQDGWPFWSPTRPPADRLREEARLIGGPRGHRRRVPLLHWSEDSGDIFVMDVERD